MGVGFGKGTVWDGVSRWLVLLIIIIILLLYFYVRTSGRVIKTSTVVFPSLLLYNFTCTSVLRKAV